MFSFFRKKKKHTSDNEGIYIEDYSFIGTDMHSHMIAGIDDGAPNLDESMKLIRGLYEVGFRKMITTPHVHGDFYRNTKDTILRNFELLQSRLEEENLPMQMEVSAEYYLDQYFLNEVLPHGLLKFGNQNILVETSLAGWPRDFYDILFTTQSKGYNIILAHPERYLYETDVEVFANLREKGIQMQLNLLSLFGYYGKGIKDMAELLLTHELYDFVGTDMHHERHLGNIGKYLEMQTDSFKRLYFYPHFKNHSL